MEPMVCDLHTHILPKMDDGSESLAMSLQLLELLQRQGVQVVCATSHYYAQRESIQSFVHRREKSYHALSGALSASLTSGLPRVVPGAETAWFPRMSQQQLEPLCLAGTRTLLVEMPFTQWRRAETEEVVSLVLDRDFQTVLVHPERFCMGRENRERLEQLADLPLGFQVNAETLIRWQTRRLGLELLEMSRYPLLGSDTHNLTSRPPYIEKARKVIRRKLGQDFLDMMDENAACALAGQGWGE